MPTGPAPSEPAPAEFDDDLAVSPPALTLAQPRTPPPPMIPVVAPLIALAITLMLIAVGFALRSRLARVDDA
jgi:hypothetical protein